MDSTKCSPIEFCRQIKELVDNETRLVNARLNLLLVSQSFLFGLYAYVDVLWLKFLLPICCCILCMIMRFATKDCECAIAFILDRWNRFCKEGGVSHDQLPPVWAGGNDGFGCDTQKRKDRIYLGWKDKLAYHKSIPLLLFWIWVIAFIRSVVALFVK